MARPEAMCTMAMLLPNSMALIVRQEFVPVKRVRAAEGNRILESCIRRAREGGWHMGIWRGQTGGSGLMLSAVSFSYCTRQLTPI